LRSILQRPWDSRRRCRQAQQHGHEHRQPTDSSQW